MTKIVEIKEEIKVMYLKTDKEPSYKDLFLEECENSKRFMWENEDLYRTIRKAIVELQLLVKMAYDCEGFVKEESLKTLINELVRYAKKSINILKGEDENDR